MKKKCRKLLALLTMLALIVTYSFSASIVSVYAEDEQGEINATTKASEEAEPETPAAEPDTPAPANDDVVTDGEDGEGVVEGEDGEGVVEGEDGEGVVEGEAGEGTNADDPEENDAIYLTKGAVVASYVLDYGETVTLSSNYGNYNSTWSLIPSDTTACTLDGTTVENTNTSGEMTTVIVRHHYIHFSWNWPSPIPIITEGEEDFQIGLLPQSFKVTFNLKKAGEDSFTKVKEETVYTNGHATAPEYPEVDENGNKFFGWYTEEACENQVDPATVDITKDMDFYAKYEATGTITFLKNLNEDVTLPTPNPLEAAVGTTVNLGAASCAGYTFTGWKTEDGQEYAKNADFVMTAEGLTLLAQWTEGAETQTTITYWSWTPGGPGGGHYTRLHEDTVDVGLSTTLWDGVPTRIGYIFLGWTTERGHHLGGPGTAEYYPGQTFDVEKQTDLYAVWKDVFRDVTINLTANSDEVTYNGKEQLVEGYVGKEESTERPGYVLAATETIHYNWPRPHDDVYKYYVPVVSAKGTNAGTYTTPTAVKVYYTVNDREWTDTHEYVAITAGKLVIKPAELVVNTDSAEKVYDGTELTAGGTVTFGDNQSATFTAEGGAITLFEGETLNIRAIGSQTEVGSSENGFIVDWGKPDGWGDSASTAKKFNYKITTGEKGTLKVTPKPATLTFDLDGGNYDGNTSAITIDCFVGDEITMPAAPTKDGFDFVEWQGSSYQPGDKYTVEGDHTFTAVWKAASTGGDSDDSDSDSEGADTGDSFGLIGLLAMMGAAMLGLIALTARRRNEE
ncbi:MAG: InlB B-repeat-containing protein [Bacillota bacterium]